METILSAGFTLGTYAHVTTSMQQTAAEKVGQFLGQKWVKGRKSKGYHQQ